MILSLNKRDFKTMTIVISYFTLINFLPGLTNATRNNQCETGPKMLNFNNYFAWIVIGSWLVAKIVTSLIVWWKKSADNVNHATFLKLGVVCAFIEALYFLIIIPVWFFWSLTIWNNYAFGPCL